MSRNALVFSCVFASIAIGAICWRFLDTRTTGNAFEADAAAHVAGGGGGQAPNSTEALELCGNLIGNEEVTALRIRRLFREGKISRIIFTQALHRLSVDSTGLNQRLEVAGVIKDDLSMRVYYLDLLSMAFDSPEASIEDMESAYADLEGQDARERIAGKLVEVMLKKKNELTPVLTWVGGLPRGSEREMAFAQLSYAVSHDEALKMPGDIELANLTESESRDLMQSLASKAGKIGGSAAIDWLVSSNVEDGSAWAMAFSAARDLTFGDAERALSGMPADISNSDRAKDQLGRRLTENHGVANVIDWTLGSSIDAATKSALIRACGIQGGQSLGLEQVSSIVAKFPNATDSRTFISAAIESRSLDQSAGNLAVVAELRKMLPK